MSNQNIELQSINTQAEIKEIFDNGKKVFTPAFVSYLFFDKEPKDKIQYLIIASKKVGNAVIRNRAKRLLRVIIRESRKALVDKKISKVILIAKSGIGEYKSTQLTKLFLNKIS